MDLIDIVTKLSSSGVTLISAIVIIVLFSIKIPKIELNVWGILGKQFNKSLINDLHIISDKVTKLDSKINNVESKFDAHVAQQERDNIRNIREYILRCNRELNAGIYFDRESLISLLNNSIDVYKKYCHEHEDFPNSQAEAAMKNIINIYNARYNNGEYKESSGETTSSSDNK